MRILIITDTKGGTSYLTDEDPMSSYGLPVLSIDADDITGVYGPADIIADGATTLYAADIVVGWACKPERTDEERSMVNRFLQQWPDRPQRLQCI